MSTPASSRAFGIVEILEIILLYADYNDITRALRISKYFRGTILGSKALRRVLWFDNDRADKIELHPFLRDCVRPVQRSDFGSETPFNVCLGPIITLMIKCEIRSLPSELMRAPIFRAPERLNIELEKRMDCPFCGAAYLASAQDWQYDMSLLLFMQRLNHFGAATPFNECSCGLFLASIKLIVSSPASAIKKVKPSTYV